MSIISGNCFVWDNIATVEQECLPKPDAATFRGPVNGLMEERQGRPVLVAHGPSVNRMQAVRCDGSVHGIAKAVNKLLRGPICAVAPEMHGAFLS